ncbi:MAG: RNA-binding cell elongation regulator Jag/EloR [Peptostreptococcaceae bacterium]
MEKSIKIKSKTKEDAINNAKNHFNVLEEDLEVIELQKPSKGFLGIFGTKEGLYEIKLLEQIKISKEVEILKEVIEENDKDDVYYAKEFLENIIKHFNINATVNIIRKKNIMNVSITGDNLNYLIGKKGETLDSIQLLTGIYLNKLNKNSNLRINLNIGNYKEKREEFLKKEAMKVSNLVLKTKKKRKLEYMNAYERRIMHSLLQKQKNINTYSEGDEPYRRLVVEYVNPLK